MILARTAKKPAENAKTFIVTYKAWVTEGDNYAGWAGEQVLEVVLKGEDAVVKWLANAEKWNEPELRNHKYTVLKIEVMTPKDCTAAMLAKGKAAYVAEKAADRKMRAAELRAEARKIERGE